MLGFPPLQNRVTDPVHSVVARLPDETCRTNPVAVMVKNLSAIVPFCTPIRARGFTPEAVNVFEGVFVPIPRRIFVAS